MSTNGLRRRLDIVRNKTDNQACVDCGSRMPTWASIIVPPPGSLQSNKPIGALCCFLCSGSHRCLGVHVSFVRSITLDTLNEKEVLALENGGNHKVNSIFEANYTETDLMPKRPAMGCDASTRESFIRAKYETRMFCKSSALKAYDEGLTVPQKTTSKANNMMTLRIPNLKHKSTQPHHCMQLKRISPLPGEGSSNKRRTNAKLISPPNLSESSRPHDFTINSNKKKFKTWDSTVRGAFRSCSMKRLKSIVAKQRSKVIRRGNPLLYTAMIGDPLY